MSVWRSIRTGGWPIGAVIGILAGVGAAGATQSWQESREAQDVAARAAAFHREEAVPPPGDAVRALLEQDGRVVIDPLLANRVPPEDLARAEEVLAQSQVPAHLAYLSYPDSGEVGYTVSGAPAQWMEGVGQDGHYLVLYDNGSARALGRGFEPEAVMTRTEGQPGPALVRVAEEMAQWEAVPASSEPDPPNESDYWGGVGGGLVAAALAGFIVVPVFLVLRALVGSRRKVV